jgi:Mn-dependent DtxR family transcriptional regulator
MIKLRFEMEGSMEEIKKEIIDFLKNKKELCISEIAAFLKKSNSTISKYLSILEAEGKVISLKKTPYKYWKLK